MTNEGLQVLRRLTRTGDLSPEHVVEEARSGDSPLHEFFEWDDTKAAHAHRLQQARTLIRSVKIEVTVDARVLRVPRYVHDPAREDDGGYVETLSLKSDRTKAMEVLQQEVKRAIACLRRVEGIASALGLKSEIADSIRQMNRILKGTEQ